MSMDVATAYCTTCASAVFWAEVADDLDHEAEGTVYLVGRRHSAGFPEPHDVVILRESAASNAVWDEVAAENERIGREQMRIWREQRLERHRQRARLLAEQDIDETTARANERLRALVREGHR